MRISRIQEKNNSVWIIQTDEIRIIWKEEKDEGKRIQTMNLRVSVWDAFHGKRIQEKLFKMKESKKKKFKMKILDYPWRDVTSLSDVS